MMGCSYGHMQAFLLFIWYTMLASALAAGLLIRSFVEIFTSGTVEDPGRCEYISQKDLEHSDRRLCTNHGRLKILKQASQVLSRILFLPPCSNHISAR